MDLYDLLYDWWTTARSILGTWVKVMAFVFLWAVVPVALGAGVLLFLRQYVNDGVVLVVGLFLLITYGVAVLEETSS